MAIDFVCPPSLVLVLTSVPCVQNPPSLNCLRHVTLAREPHHPPTPFVSLLLVSVRGVSCQGHLFPSLPAHKDMGYSFICSCGRVNKLNK